MRLRTIVPLLAVALSLATGASAGASPAAQAADQGLEARRQAFAALLAEHWEDNLSRNPEFASILGDKRWNDEVSDFSAEAIAASQAKSREFLKRFEAVDTTGFPEQEALSRDLMVRELKENLAAAELEPWLMPVNQISGIHLQAAQFPSILTFETAKDYEDLIARYKKMPGLFDQTMTHMRRGMAKGLMPPKFLLEKVVTQTAGIAATKPEESPFAEPLSRFPESLPEAERQRLRTAMLDAIRGSLLPAYQRFAAFVEKEYAPQGRTEVGLWALPDGARRYAFEARQSTTTDLTPDEIHAIGLREVAAIEAQMLEIAKKLGYKDLPSFNSAIEKMPRLKATSGEQILDLYRRYTDQMYAELPKLFGRLPKAEVEIVPVEAFRAKEAPGAQYQPPAPDGSRPGRVQVNTSDATSRKVITFESTAYHEGVPGHHLQLAISQELPALPEFRRHGGTTAFVEGWALYSERLGKEVGFYQDPYNDYGRLQDEMLRAIRLVVDTGLHHKRWTRDQVVLFFRDHSAIDEVDIQVETDRYIVWPGQALAYKIGQLKILELRERAKQALGDRFDVRAFHDEVLGGGGLPLDVLEARIDRWIAARKGSGAR